MYGNEMICNEIIANHNIPGPLKKNNIKVLPIHKDTKHNSIYINKTKTNGLFVSTTYTFQQNKKFHSLLNIYMTLKHRPL